VEERILYINDDYVRFTDAHSVQKSYDRNKADYYLSTYFSYSQEDILKARDLVKKNSRLQEE
ncbi:MAG: hypothetical protein PHE86_02505, partial [Candidatus Marinimicrobia bacterium]|nr:hypothetical protein [Candidatus Neomarinimicrobiota bacterium]